ncbi:PIR protein [Plasmodium vivax]|uniref:VIR protein n=1 Tax=Plasmodium vivax TaxID=5855 RepID=A0A564ZS93_PLAVI|nr:PIR protein [Plasmodium vivax]
MGHIRVSTYTPNTGLTRDGCLEIYTNVLVGAEKKIEELFPKSSTNLSKACAEFNKYLEEKKGELNKCYKQDLLSFFLDKAEELKDTIQKCANNSQDSRNSATQTELKGEEVHVTEDSCREKGNCNPETTTSGGETKLKILEELSAARNLGAHGTLEKGLSQNDELVARATTHSLQSISNQSPGSTGVYILNNLGEKHAHNNLHIPKPIGTSLHETRPDSANAVASQLDGKSAPTEVPGVTSDLQITHDDEDSDSEVSCGESVCYGTTSDKTCCKGTVKLASGESTVRETSIRDTPPKAGDTSALVSPDNSDALTPLVERPKNFGNNTQSYFTHKNSVNTFAQ